MEAEKPSQTSIDSVKSILSNYSDEPPKDRTVTHCLVRDARSLVTQHATGSFIKGHAVATDRILLALIDNAVDDQGQRYIATAIVACKSQPDPMDFLKTLGTVWLTQLLFPVKAAGMKRAGVPSEHQTPTVNETASLIERASRGDLRALRLVLRRRQGDKCPISDTYSDEAAPGLVNGSVQAPLVTSHILPFSLNDIDENKTASFKPSAITWDMLGAWGSFDIMKINSPANAILLRADLDPQFGRFQFWFEATDQENTYKLISKTRNTGFNNNIITFANHDNKPIELPDPKILALHAAFAKVFYASGAGEYIESVWRDMDTIHLLSTDGSTDLGPLNVTLQRLVEV